MVVTNHLGFGAGPTTALDLAVLTGLSEEDFTKPFGGFGVVFATDSSGEVFIDVTLLPPVPVTL